MRLTAIVQMNLRIDPIVVMVMAMFALPVMTVDPMMTVLRPMAWNPDHLVIALPVTGTMGVVRMVADFDVKSRLCRQGGPESEARHYQRNE